MATAGSGTSLPVIGNAQGTYTLGQLILLWRRRLDDEAEPYLWNNEELTEFADRLQKELSHEMPLFEDRWTDDVCRVALTAGADLLTLSGRVKEIISAALIGGTELTIVDSSYMDRLRPGWSETEEVDGVVHLVAERGTPTHLVKTGQTTAVLYPPLEDATATLELRLLRGPLVDLNYDAHAGEYLEVDKFSHLLVYGIMFQAFTKSDADTGAGTRAEQYRVLWEGRDGYGGDKERIKRLVWTAKGIGAQGVADIV